MAKNIDRASREARIAALREHCQRLSDERVALEDINEAEDAAPWLGACFKYYNRERDGGRGWWTYYRVLSHDGGNSFVVLQCQKQSGGWNIATSNEHIYLLPDPKARGFVRITRYQFDEAWRQYVLHVASLNDGASSPVRRGRSRKSR